MNDDRRQQDQGKKVFKPSVRKRVEPHAYPPSRPPLRRSSLYFALWFSCVVGSTTVVSASYDDWVRQARQGDYPTAIQGLEAYEIQHPHEQRVQWDLLRVYSWSAQPHKVVQRYKGLARPQALPADVLLVVARAYKDTQQWQQALSLYQDGAQRFPQHAAFKQGVCMSLADLGQNLNALTCAQQLVLSSKKQAEALLVLSYVYRVTRQPYEALRVSQRALALYPTNTEVIRQHDQALHAAGLHRQAVEWQQRYPSVFTEAERQRRQVDYAAELTRLAPQPTRTHAERFVLADRALQLHQNLLATTAEETAELQTRLRGDQLIALEVRELPSNAHSALLSPAQLYPRYAQASLGALLLRERQPERAIASYEEALHDPHLDAPTRMRYQTGLAFALLEAGREQEALTLAETMESETPLSYQLPGNPEPLANPLYTDALTLKNSLYLYSGLLHSARKNLKEASDLAPTNVNLRVALADAQRLSGLPRQAEKNLRIAESSSPRQEDVLISQAQTAFDLQEYRQTEELLHYVQAHYPTNTRVEELEKDWLSHRKNQLILRSGFERGKGADVSGQDGFQYEAQWYSAPIDHNWRATVVAGFFQTKDELGHNVSWQQAGMRHEQRDWTSQFLVNHQKWGHGSKVGARADTEYALNDYWQIGGQLEYRSLALPNRALAQGITGNSAQVHLSAQSGPERWLQAAYGVTRFTDHNVRHSLQLTANQRLITRPRIKLDAQAELWLASNRAQNTPYFNPRREYMLVPALRVEQLLYQRYEQRLSHALTLGAGIYHQKNYGQSGVGTATYELSYQHSRDLEVGLRLQALTRPYDGKREQHYNGVLELKIKF